MYNILIIEDDPSHLNAIISAINDEFKNNEVKIYPEIVNGLEQNCNNSSYIIKQLRGGNNNFKEVAENFEHINLFVIDATLTPKSDIIGIDFFHHLKSKDIETKAIIISNTPDVRHNLETSIPFIPKLEYGIEHFPKALIEEIRKILNIEDETFVEEVGTKPTQKSLSIFQRISQILGVLQNNIKSHGWRYAFTSLKIFFITNFQRNIIDSLVLLLFYALLVTTIFSGGLNIIREIINLSHEDETMLLKLAEHIFLNLIPIFIVFGFFNYYKTNIRVSLLEGNTQSVNEEISTKAINLSKTLFISSIISYVLIKVIEELFIDKIVDITRLISFGFLLLMLMTYFIFLDRKNH